MLEVKKIKRKFDIPSTMKAVITSGNGGYDKLEYKSVPVPILSSDEVLLKVLAAGINNTDINTRLGWYSSSVTSSTDAFIDEQEKNGDFKQDGGWKKATPFPMIQGTDCCGLVVDIGKTKRHDLLGSRVLVRACMRPKGFTAMEKIWMASDFDGAFAEYVKVSSSEVFPINCKWSDAELATIPCAYATSENMLERADCNKKDHVLVMGSSGGVGSATIQLAKRRGCKVTAVTSFLKMKKVKTIGADNVIDSSVDLVKIIGENKVSLVVDNVAGEKFPQMLKILRPGGKYVSSGAIAGPIVSLDMRDMYLKDITLIGSTAWDEPVFPNIISYIENSEIRPLLEKTFPLDQITQAQKEFIKKEHIGNFVLIP